MEKLAPQTIVDNKYKVLSVLGIGGMGIVYRVEQISLRAERALKTIFTEGRTLSPDLRQRFEQEAKAASRLEHSNLVKVFDFGILDGSTPYFVMEIVEGMTLGERVKTRGRLNLEQCLSIFIPAAFALSYVHDKSIVHRDMKPANIMITESEDQDSGRILTVKVLDFGIAKMVNEGSQNGALTKPGEVIGSPSFMSPEQSAGRKIDSRSDIYSLGCTMFEALTGRPPFKGSTHMDVIMQHQTTEAPGLSEVSAGQEFDVGIEAVIKTTLQKEPADRYQTMNDLAEDLMAIKKGRKPLHALAILEERGMVAIAPRSVKNSATQTGDDDRTLALGQNFADDRDSSWSGTGGHEFKPSIWQKQSVKLAAVGIAIVAAGLAYSSVFYNDGDTGGGTKSGAGADTSNSANGQNRSNNSNNSGSDNSNADSSGSNNSSSNNSSSDNSANSDSRDSRSSTAVHMPGNHPTAAETARIKIETRDGFFSRVVDQVDLNGVKRRIRIFEFPNNISLGSLFMHDTGPEIQARGTVRVPAAVKLSFYPSSICFIHPQLLKKFRPEEINQLCLSAYEHVSDEHIASLSHLVGITKLDISDTELTPACLADLNKLTSVVELEVAACSIGDDALSRLKRLRQLKIFQIRQMNPIDKTIKALAGSTQLKKLKVINTGLTNEHLKLLAMNRDLDYLSISFNSAITDDGIASLKPLKKLEHLNIAGVNLTGKCFPVLKSFPRLRELVVAQRLYTDKDRAVLARYLPKGCQIKIDKASNAESLDGLDELSKISP